MSPMSLTNVVTETSNVLLVSERLTHDGPQGLRHYMAMISLAVWYISSGTTLFSNKYILASFNGDAFSLGMFN
jgi:hypothetical protein